VRYHLSSLFLCSLPLARLSLRYKDLLTYSFIIMMLYFILVTVSIKLLSVMGKIFLKSILKIEDKIVQKSTLKITK